MLTLYTLSLGVLGATVMGYAIQRGATCMVAAVGELANTGRAHRLIAILETGAWVACGLMLAELLQMRVIRPPPSPVLWTTVAGGVVLGLGAHINGGCVFGAIARLGSGEAAFALTPVGFFAGAWTFAAALPHPTSRSLLAPPVSLHIAWPLLVVFLAYGSLRLWNAVSFPRTARDDARYLIRSPHTATLVIGLAFVAMLLSVGPWTYPELLSDLARGRTHDVGWRILLFGALLAGAVLGGRHAGKWRWRGLNARQSVMCLVGGALMGVGSAAIPGANDGLLLIGLPFLYPHAIVALAAMGGTIYIAIKLESGWAIG